VAGVHAAHARPGLAEDRVLGGDRQIAEHVQHVAAADREPVDHRDDGLRDVANRGVQRLDVHRTLATRTGGAWRIAALTALFLVAARAERLIAGAGQHDHPDRSVPSRVQERVGQLRHGRGAEGVAHLGSVDGDPRDAVLLLVEDVRVRHAPSDLYAGGG
jgi:hypothetical protein